MSHGQITHIEFPYDDAERARRFYSELFGWQFGEMDAFPGYLLFNGGTAQIGGALGERGKSAADHMRVYTEVDSIDAVVGRVEELGGRVVEGKNEIPGQGWYAVILDSEGNEVGLYEGLGG